jgi:hypothetical protein
MCPSPTCPGRARCRKPESPNITHSHLHSPTALSISRQRRMSQVAVSNPYESCCAEITGAYLKTAKPVQLHPVWSKSRCKDRWVLSRGAPSTLRLLFQTDFPAMCCRGAPPCRVRFYDSFMPWPRRTTSILYEGPQRAGFRNDKNSSRPHKIQSTSGSLARQSSRNMKKSIRALYGLRSACVSTIYCALRYPYPTGLPVAQVLES